MSKISRRTLLSGVAAAPVAVLLPHVAISAQSGSDNLQTGPKVKTHKVNIKNSAFSPARVTLKVGDKITFRNRDTLPHTATDQGGSWDTGDMAGKKSVRLGFETPGTYNYVCRYHPNMRGTVVVQG